MNNIYKNKQPLSTKNENIDGGVGNMLKIYRQQISNNSNNNKYNNNICNSKNNYTASIAIS